MHRVSCADSARRIAEPLEGMDRLLWATADVEFADDLRDWLRSFTEQSYIPFSGYLAVAARYLALQEDLGSLLLEYALPWKHPLRPYGEKKKPGASRKK